ncbi:MAG TPA: alpha/beta hydrolase [Acidimicrobiia bacterium]|nr:alpha/beta hydrolase [Acidimicrobiia bacterium]
MKKRSMLKAAVAGWALWRLLGPEAGPRHRGIQSRPEGPTGRTIVAGRHEFFVREAGPADGPPIVLLHGWLYDGFFTWHKVIPALAERHRVIALDLRNHGKSDRIRGRFEIADVADDIARLFDVLEIAGVPVVGFSMGGMALQEFAVRHPGRASHVILGGTAAHPVDRPRTLTVPLFVIGRALARLDRFMLPRIAHTYLMRTGAFPPEHSAWLWQNMLDRDTDLYYEGGFAILRFDARDRVGDISAPTLFIIPTDDQLIEARLQYDTASLIPSATVLELAGARHEAVITHGDEIAKAILGFVE